MPPTYPSKTDKCSELFQHFSISCIACPISVFFRHDRYCAYWSRLSSPWCSLSLPGEQHAGFNVCHILVLSESRSEPVYPVPASRIEHHFWPSTSLTCFFHLFQSPATYTLHWPSPNQHSNKITLRNEPVLWATGTKWWICSRPALRNRRDWDRRYSHFKSSQSPFTVIERTALASVKRRTNMISPPKALFFSFPDLLNQYHKNYLRGTELLYSIRACSTSFRSSPLMHLVRFETHQLINRIFQLTINIDTLWLNFRHTCGLSQCDPTPLYAKYFIRFFSCEIYQNQVLKNINLLGLELMKLFK